MDQASPTTTHDRAHAVRDQLAALVAPRAEQAFLRGELLLECERDGLFAVLGFDTQDAFLQAMGMKRAAALSDKAVAAKFDRAAHAHVGISRLRLLAADFIPDALDLLANGIEVIGDDGVPSRVPVKSLAYRALRDALARYKQAAPAVAVASDVAQAAAALLGEPLASAAEPTGLPMADGTSGAEVFEPVLPPAEGMGACEGSSTAPTAVDVSVKKAHASACELASQSTAEPPAPCEVTLLEPSAVEGLVERILADADEPASAPTAEPPSAAEVTPPGLPEVAAPLEDAPAGADEPVPTPPATPEPQAPGAPPAAPWMPNPASVMAPAALVAGAQPGKQAKRGPAIAL